MQQANDFLEEVDLLAQLLKSIPEDSFETVTQFKGWTVNDVVGHLHMFDVAAMRSLESDDAFEEFFAPILERQSQGFTLLQTQYPFLNGLQGRALFETWYETALKVGAAFFHADPKRRLRWAGPDMSAKSNITARQMETWAHGHEIFDIFGEARRESDRIKNICHLGVVTYGWTFMNQKMPVPDPAPYVDLTAPSGAKWVWNEASDTYVKGDAVEFAQVVTQVRNVKDTALVCSGEAAQVWMENAQCFAGPPNLPPEQGTRYRKS